jgi:hypothetical protein
MSLTDEEFREQHKPLHVPAAYNEAHSVTDKVIFALADVGAGTADQVIRHIEELDPGADHKPVIAATRQVLTGLYEQGQIAGAEKEGNLVYSLQKITRANDGAVDPDLLAPGLD